MDEAPDTASSPSMSIGSPSSSPTTSVACSDSEPVVVPKKRGAWERSWPAADEIALLEVFSEYWQKHRKFPPHDELAAALRWRIQSEHRRSGDQLTRRINILRARYKRAARDFARGTVPIAADDIRIYKLSKIIWKDSIPRVKKPRAADTRRDWDTREFGDLAALYPCLAREVEGMDADCGAAAGLLVKVPFQHIDDKRAAELEKKVQKLQMAEFKAGLERDCLRNKVVTTILGWKSEW